MHPSTLSPNTVFKNPCLKAIREFSSFEHELPVLLAWFPANKLFAANTHCQSLAFRAAGT